VLNAFIMDPMRSTKIIIFILLIIIPASAACAPPPPQPVSLPPESQAEWSHADLRWVGPGDAPNPQQDLIAAYARNTGDELRIRLDFLELGPAFPFDIYLALDNASGGEKSLPLSGTAGIEWNELLIFTAANEVLLQIPGEQPRQTNDVYLSTSENFDGFVLHLDARFLIPGTFFQIFITPPNSLDIIDATPPVALNGAAPAPAQLLLAFWDTLPAATPAQAMRRWNGAHTGPLGQRHGLFQLLKASDKFDIPLVLLDLKNPSSLAAMATMDQLQWVRTLEERGLLVLPDSASGDLEDAAYSLNLSRRTGSQYSLQPSPFLFAPLQGPLPEGYQAAFHVSADERIAQISSGRLIPLPGEIYPEEGAHVRPDEQVNRTGLTLATKRKLLDAALSNDLSRITVMGGSLPDSLWADSSITAIAFAYLAHHPWIETLDQEDLLAIPVNPSKPQSHCSDLLCTPFVLPFIPYTTAGTPIANGLTLPELRQIIRADLATAPTNTAAELAWQMFLNLTMPTSDPYRQALQANYLGQTGHLLHIARWAANPTSINDCTLDLDWDGVADCVLASDHFIATFKSDGGRMLFAGSLQQGDWIQWIGPASQLQVGAGERQDWQIQRGAAADPNEIPGAFTSQSDPFALHDPVIKAGTLTFLSENGIEKTYTITPGGFRFTYRSSTPSITHLPLLLSPNVYWGEPLSYSALSSPENHTFTLGAGLHQQLIAQASSAELHADSFIDSIEWLQQSENPEQAYPAGHFIPFPMVVLEIQAGGSFTVEIQHK
jgi:hypothetical protein